VPSTTLLEIPPAEQVQMRAILRRTRYGSLRAFPILLLCAAGRNPTEMAALLLCSRSSVYRIVRAYRAGSLGIQIDEDGQLSIAVQSTILRPWLTRSLGACSKKPRVPLAGAAPDGVVRPSPRRSRPTTGWRSRRQPCGAGSIRSAGGGNVPNAWPKMTPHTGSNAWPGCGFSRNIDVRMR
jgi:hypothetical protein